MPGRAFGVALPKKTFSSNFIYVKTKIKPPKIYSQGVQDSRKLLIEKRDFGDERLNHNSLCTSGPVGECNERTRNRKRNGVGDINNGDRPALVKAPLPAPPLPSPILSRPSTWVWCRLGDSLWWFGVGSGPFWFLRGCVCGIIEIYRSPCSNPPAVDLCAPTAGPPVPNGDLQRDSLPRRAHRRWRLRQRHFL